MERLQVVAVLAREILFGELELQLVVPVELPLAPAQSGHLVRGELPHVLLHPGQAQPWRGPAVLVTLHHLK